MYNISNIFIYPIKSLGGIEVFLAKLTDRGLQYDRRFMLVDGSNHFLTQRQHPQMCLLQTAIEDNQLVIYHKNDSVDKIVVSLQPAPGATIKVQVWEDECEAQVVSAAADEWFCDKLSIHCRLVYMPDETRRKVDGQFALKDQLSSFADAYPLLMIGQPSLDDLNKRLPEPLTVSRFRPNIVFTGGQPYDEDTMEQARIKKIDLYGVKLCSRCVLTTIDQSTAVKSKEPLKTLSGYRMKNNKIYFGQNMLHSQKGLITVGDEMEIIKTKERVLFDGQQS